MAAWCNRIAIVVNTFPVRARCMDMDISCSVMSGPEVNSAGVGFSETLHKVRNKNYTWFL
jgi:hypothetical protein